MPESTTTVIARIRAPWRVSLLTLFPFLCSIVVLIKPELVSYDTEPNEPQGLWDAETLIIASEEIPPNSFVASGSDLEITGRAEQGRGVLYICVFGWGVVEQLQPIHW